MSRTTGASVEGPASDSGRNIKEVREETISASYQSDILKALFVSTIIPLVLLEVSTVGSNFIDSLVVSQLMGTQDLAVQGLASPYFSVVGIVGACSSPACRP